MGIVVPRDDPASAFVRVWEALGVFTASTRDTVCSTWVAAAGWLSRADVALRVVLFALTCVLIARELVALCCARRAPRWMRKNRGATLATPRTARVRVQDVARREKQD